MSREYAPQSTSGHQWSVTSLWIAVSGAGAIGLVWTWIAGLSTLLLAGVVAGFVVVSGVVGWLVRSVDDQPLTLATVVTFARGVALAAFTGFLVAGIPDGSLAWAPAVLFAAAAGLDAVDGWIARSTDSESAFGARLDVEVDALTVLFGTLLVVREALVPAVFVLVGLARYLFVFGSWLRTQRGQPVADLPPSQLRKLLGGLAMSTIWVAMLPAVPVSVSRPLALVVLVPFTINFCRDWLAVSGHRPNS